MAQRHLFYPWRSLEPGQEVLYRYDGLDHCAEEFLATYGFALPGARPCLESELLA